MAKKKNRDTGAKTCKCSVCGLVCKSTIPGKQHRRCSSNPESSTPRDKCNNLPSTQRGVWI